ncbi:protein of unknown function [Candidatus Promineifilum breve]|uniref:Transglycosylase SLT domain-containing protein n=1 Tax=Candidatus Promineifilum breve TaxID=1806508 RepID=A0A160SYX7_9CHLR|nr:transglycosylase SLT domain-containing protein [Candidatus Promineifilum breve]CUS02304.2 protein of unknown function [Candidatus Promineifilum breve]
MSVRMLGPGRGAAGRLVDRSSRRLGYRPCWLLAAVLLAFLPTVVVPRPANAAYRESIAARQVSPEPAHTTTPPVLSPYWEPDIQRLQGAIGGLAAVYGFHPDFIAAVIRHEADRESGATGHGGLVGLMGLLSPGRALAWRSSSEQLLIPTTNLRWGLAILSHVVQQSGGDLFTALAAYNGGWAEVNSRTPREYAARVLDSYGRALIARHGLSPEMANRWTIAVQMRAGNVPAESLLILGTKPIAGLRTYAGHTVYAFAGQGGQTYYVRAYVVPLGLSEFVTATSSTGFDGLEAPLRARLGEKAARGRPDARVLLACLSGLERLRGQVTTRWFAPSNCPAAGR